MIGYGAINRYFTLAVSAFPPALGSLVSVLWHAGAIWSFFQIITRRQRLTGDKHVILISTFMYIYVLSSIFSSTSNYVSLKDLTSLLPLFTFFLFPFSYSVWSISEKKAIARACSLGSMVACYSGVILAAFQFHVLGIRAEGGAGNALVFAPVMAMAGAVCLSAALSIGKKTPLPLLGAYLASMVALVYSGSRMVWFAASCTTLLILLIFRGQLRHILSRRIVFSAGIILAIIAAASFNLVLTRFQMMFQDLNNAAVLGNYDTPVGLRLILWQTGLDLFFDKPLFGYGIQSTRELVRHSLQEGFGISREFSHFHNGILTLLIESGVAGTLSILAVFVAAAIYAFRVLRRHGSDIERFGAAILSALVLVYLISGMTNLLIGHDIIDAMLMIFLTIGSYLALGSSLLPQGSERKTP